MYRGPWSFIRSFPTPNMKILSPPHVPEHVKLRWGSQQRHSYLQPFHSFSRREGKKNNNNAIQATRDSSMHRPRPSQWLVPHRGNGARMHDRGGGVHTLQWLWPWCAAGRCDPSSLCRLSGHMSRAREDDSTRLTGGPGLYLPSATSWWLYPGPALQCQVAMVMNGHLSDFRQQVRTTRVWLCTTTSHVQTSRRSKFALLFKLAFFHSSLCRQGSASTVDLTWTAHALHGSMESEGRHVQVRAHSQA